jgi:ATP-binding cassette subfamily C (CFTR/MRP) protein 4
LLDDPLSAVDPEVSSKLFHECIRGYLKHKLVILVTHQIQYLEDCEKILLLKEGKVVACGNYEEITKTGFNIKDILDTFLSANEDKNADKNKSPGKL